MLRRSYRYFRENIVANLPEKLPWWKKAYFNLANLVSRIRISFNQSTLDDLDRKMVLETIQRGDLILGGCQHRFSSLVINAPFTHTMLCLGDKRIVHSTSHGVNVSDFRELIQDYDAIMVLRLKKMHEDKMDKAIEYALSQVGKPYDFDFKYNNDDSFYCSQLVCYAFLHAGIDFMVGGTEKYDKVYKKLFNVTALHPMQYISESFEIVFVSHNIAIKNGEIVLE